MFKLPFKHSPDALRLEVMPDLGPLNNRIRAAQYRRKKAILAANPRATFPVEIYQKG